MGISKERELEICGKHYSSKANRVISELWGEIDKLRMDLVVYQQIEEIIKAKLDEHPMGSQLWVRAMDGFYVYRDAKEEASKLTNCKDCGVATTPGDGAARCKECWDSRCGYPNEENCCCWGFDHPPCPVHPKEEK